MQKSASGATENDEDFSWEDDEDESVTPPAPAVPAAASGALDKGRASNETLQPPTDKTATATASYPSSLVTSPSPSNTGSREASEDGYDVVSSGSAGGAGVESTIKAKKEAKKSESEDGDSDWE